MAQKNNEKIVLFPEKDERLAELVGIILGDGGIYTNNSRSMYELRVAGNSNTDKSYLLEYIKPLIEDLFGLKVRVYYQKRRACLHIVAQGKKLISFLETVGLKSGNKLKNDVSIPEWIFDSEIFLKSCIRGLIDTDGTILPITGRNYTYIWFTCGIPRLREDFDRAMMLLEYKTSRWNSGPSKTAEVYIGAKSSIIKYYKEIGFHNPKHIKRFKMPQEYAPLV